MRLIIRQAPFYCHNCERRVVRVAKLTLKQQTFVDEYLVDLNATQAAIRAGYSVKDADKIGTKLLRNTRIEAAIDKAMAERSRVICY